jgi:HSP20 family protein
MNVSRYEPWTVLNDLQRQLNQYYGREGSTDGGVSSGATADWIPPADVEEYADRFVLKVDIPGVNANAVEITLEQGILSISGQREKEVSEKDIQSVRIERLNGRFHRRFALPDTVDSDKVRAAGRNGVLQIEIPKQPKAQPKRIQVALDN